MGVDIEAVREVWKLTSARHAELAEASLPLRSGLFNEAVEMLRQAQHDGLKISWIASFGKNAVPQKQLISKKNILHALASACRSIAAAPSVICLLVVCHPELAKELPRLSI
ncbi:hypothetical protein [Hymenobacter elongatus]|uniref:Uncharacterized protein n=1 Tax=Hymenobacter elongatus TaxID=877208 RepID=A0A4Z0PG88_9BACT|nr:hypothetical protein [Hymenobacter elongatus]TGE14141.1 hypothetical protein E5J99_17525 [Hymenobacter elongatus]